MLKRKPYPKRTSRRTRRRPKTADPTPLDPTINTTDRTLAQKGWVDHTKLPKGPNGLPCCRYCGEECPPPKRTFCSEQCVHEWKIRTNPGYVRRCLFAKERGVCRKCKLDTEAARKHAIKLPPEDRQVLMDSLGILEPDRSWWCADHIVEVRQGGGCCGLDNYQTLCCRCHVQKTNAVTKSHKKTIKDVK